MFLDNHIVLYSGELWVIDFHVCYVLEPKLVRWNYTRIDEWLSCIYTYRWVTWLYIYVSMSDLVVLYTYRWVTIIIINIQQYVYYHLLVWRLSTCNVWSRVSSRLFFYCRRHYLVLSDEELIWNWYAQA